MLISPVQVPGQILVEPKGGKPAHLKGFQLKSWLHGQSSRDGDSMSLKVRSWLFDGTFNQVQDVVGIVAPQRSSDSFDIRDLNFYPTEFSSDEAVANLKGRGRMFWKCRTRNYVFHRELAGDRTEDSVRRPVFYMLTTAMLTFGEDRIPIHGRHGHVQNYASEAGLVSETITS